MNPETPASFLGPSHVVVPLTFFQKLLSCYYGQGPRLHEPTPPIVPPVSVPEPSEGMGGVTTIPGPPMSRPWKITPKGAAAPVQKEGPANEPRTDPTTQG